MNEYVDTSAFVNQSRFDRDNRRDARLDEGLLFFHSALK